MSSNHSRNPSEETNSSTAASYNMILEHVLQYPSNYEIPLRTMYTLNCAPRAQPLPKDLSSGSTPTADRASPVAWNDAESATMNFTTQLMSHIGSLPSQPSSLPPSFIVSFVSRCFHPCLSLVDFPQALTALDYLRDLENRRRREMIAAYERVHIHQETFDADVAAMSDKFPGIALWAKNVEGKNKKAEHYYSQLWLGLRRWIMINELSLQPFNKLNCISMLNTLLPPQPPKGANMPVRLPAPLLTSDMMREERDGFFDYIRLVQKSGPGILKRIIEMHKGPEDENGWAPVHHILEKYLKVAKNMIDDCMNTQGTEDFKPVDEVRKGKKTDSGVSFGSDRRPSTGSSHKDKALPDSPIDRSSQKGLSTLERITREFKRMRIKTKPQVEEIVQINYQPAADLAQSPIEAKGKKQIKKARSLANLAHLGRNASSTSLSGSLASSRKGSEVAPFNADEMKRHRMMYEATTAASKESKTHN